MEWRIDAWDARGGCAFATQRNGDADIGDPGDDDYGPTVFISPPSFRPEQIANIGIALSARRQGVFDPRVPMNRDLPEASFETADAVADFVRRAYIGSAGNRGGDDGGVIGVDGGPEAPPPSEPGEPGAARGFLDAWTKGVRELEAVADFSCRFFGFEIPRIFAVPSSTTSGQLESVQSGALQVLATVLDAVPLNALDTFRYEQWHLAASTLDAALTELGLWRSWLTMKDPLRSQIDHYLRHRGSIMFRPPEFLYFGDGILFAQMLLRWQPTVSDPENAAKRFQHNLHFTQHYDDYNYARNPAPPAERYEALFDWPLPRYVNMAPRSHSVGELLAAFVSSPADFIGNASDAKASHSPKEPPGALDIVTFAAALLASRAENRRQQGWRERAAATWLARSVPQWLFRNDVEALIRDPEQRQVVMSAGR